MTQRRECDDFLEDILNAARIAQSFVAGVDHEAFASDEKTVYAVVRALEIVGEATKRIPQEVRDQKPWSTLACDGRDAR